MYRKTEDLPDFKNDEGKIVFLLSFCGPILDGPQYVFFQFGGRQSGVFRQNLDQAVFAELFTKRVSSFNNSVGECDQGVAAPQLYFLLLELSVTEEAKHGSTGVEPPQSFHVAFFIANQQRRIV